MQASSFPLKNWDLILPFGKHAGKTVSWVRENFPDYLQWMVEESKRKQEDFIHKGLNWTEIARNALKGGDLNLSGGDGDRMHGMSVVDLGAPAAGEPTKRTVVVFREGIDNASMFLLKDFVLRQDQSVGLYSWLVKYAEEAVNFGTKKYVETTGKDGKTTTQSLRYTYDNRTFHFAVTPVHLILEHVSKSVV